uniref:uncharacterized protein LOC124073572 n=1 Tax=Scatophagus argus TaxID=75038 RepID=UPI001ED800D7|nr:uncharacterized protein LOC124073572 [Scatophagus argus]
MSERLSFIRFLAGFILITAGVHASCPIELSPPRVVVRYGDPVSVNCSTSESQFDGIGWEVPIGGTGSVNVTHLTWTVNRLTEWNITPLCFFSPSKDSPLKQCVLSPDVVVYTFPENISISSSNDSDGVMNEKEEYQFTCRIPNIAPVRNLTVTWYKGDTIIHTDTFDNPSKEPVNQSPVFKFTPSRQDNGVIFRCEAHLNLWPEGPQLNISSQEYNITVYFGPDVQCSALELPEGETLKKHCPVTGNPPPSVKWLKDGQPTDPTIGLRRENAGLYTVTAEGFSSTKKTLQVVVLYKPEVRCPSTYTALEYAPHNLTCIVSGYPEPETIWYKDDEEVELPKILTRRDMGQYLIISSNSLSSVNHTVEIIVTYPPSQIAELEDSQVDVGSVMWLKCSAMGNPRPQYFWNYYQTDNVIEENEDGVSLLIIHNATAYNMGSYTCHAWNDIGNVSKTVRVTVKGAEQKCPIEISPERMVIQYQSRSQTVTCNQTSSGSRNKGDVFWKLQGIETNSASWVVDTQKHWDPRPVCTFIFNGAELCNKSLNFYTLYKTPDSVSIRLVNNLSSVVEDQEFQLQCDITNVAPARNLVVRWYRGNETFEPPVNGSRRVTGCQTENKTDCDVSVVLHPLNVSFVINITLNRTHSGAEFRCEAQLDLEAKESQPSPNMSSPLNLTVFYKPTINTTKLPKTVPVIADFPQELVCEADGYPLPHINWSYSAVNVIKVSENTLIVSEAGFYNCSATNTIDSTFHEVQVILKKDYLPLIAGFVAVTVVAISVVFLFIYSIYYKNTRMRRYSLKNPKLSTHNGNVAHNGWDLQFPMTKLSYTSLSVANWSPQRPQSKGEGIPTALTWRGSGFGNIRSEHCCVYCQITMWFLMFVGVLACTGKPVISSCPLVISPPIAVVEFGGSFFANCSSTTDQVEGMGWESSNGGVSLTKRVSSLALHVVSLTDWTLEPKCFINYNNNDQCLEVLPVIVYKLPDSVSMSAPNLTGPMVEGNKYRMQCDVVNVAPVRNLTVEWHKENAIIHTETFDKQSAYSGSMSSVFDLMAHRDYDGTKIWCEAKLNFGAAGQNVPSTKSQSREVATLYPPTFAEPANETLEMSTGRKITLNCTATGNPMPAYSWQLPHAIQAKSKNQTTLNVSFEVPGTYKCTASNTQGTRTKYFTVKAAPRNYTTLAALVGGFAMAGVLFLISGLFFVTPEGTFSCSKGSYLRGHPTSSGPVSAQRIRLCFSEACHLLNFPLSLSPPTPQKSAGMKGALLSQHSSLQSSQSLFKLGIISLSLLSPLSLSLSLSLATFHRRLSAENNMENNFLLWILTLCMFYSVSGEGCSLILKPSRVVVGFGEPVSVSCEAARPVRVLGWESAISAAHTQQDLSVQWKVDSLIDWIEEPICYGVFFTAPRQCEEKLNLVLYKTPDSVSIRPVNHTGPMVEGKEYQLLCEVQNIAPVQYLTLRWYRGQTEVYNHSFSDLTSSSPVQVSSVLVITPTKAENGAQYRCVAVLELGPEGPQPPPTVTSEPLNASVYFPPVLLSPEPEVLDLIVGAEITLNCTAIGNPTPVYSWQSSHPIQESMEDEAVLTSSSLLPGTYTCTASNTLEKKSKQFIIKAKTKGV